MLAISIEPTWDNLLYPPAGYEYFHNMAPFVPGAAQLVKTNACWMVDAAILAYGKNGHVDMSSVEFESILRQADFTSSGQIGDWSPGAHGTQGFVAANNRFALVSFRGTGKEDWTDLAHDLMALPVREGDCRVHEGFRSALDSVWPTVEHWVKQIRDAHPGAEICFTGHSLGAALATLTLSRLDVSSPLSLYTFGSPRVGDASFCTKVLSKNAKIFRIANGEDLVTHLPPKDFFYEHVGDVWHLTEASLVHEDPPERGFRELRGAIEILGDVLANLPAGSKEFTPAETPLRDHSPCRYLVYTWKHFGQRSLAATPY